jgi:hypothetical protein
LTIPCYAHRLLVPILLLCGLVAWPDLASAQWRGSDDPIYQAAKADLKADRPAMAIAKLKTRIAAGIDDATQLWTYRLALAVAYDALKEPVATLEAIQAFVRALEASRAPLPKGWSARKEGMQGRARQIEAQVLETHGAVDVASTPTGARILIDGVPYGADAGARTPTRLYLAPGRHLLRLDLERHEPAEAYVNVAASVERAVTLALTRGDSNGTLIVRTGADEARVFVDDEPRGEGRELSLDLPAGQYVVRVSREGYADDTSTVTVLTGEDAWMKAVWDAPVIVKRPVKEKATDGFALDPLWGWVIGGSGAALLLAGVPFTVLAYQDRDEMAGLSSKAPTTENDKKFNNLKSSMQTKESVAGVLYGVGVATALGGATWLVLGELLGDGSADPDTAVGLQPLPGGAAITFGGRW